MPGCTAFACLLLIFEINEKRVEEGVQRRVDGDYQYDGPRVEVGVKGNCASLRQESHDDDRHPAGEVRRDDEGHSSRQLDFAFLRRVILHTRSGALHLELLIGKFNDNNITNICFPGKFVNS